MPTLPEGQSLLVRTHFAADDVWQQIAADAQASHRQADGTEAQAFLTVVDDSEFSDLTPTDLAELIPSPPPYYVFVVDRQACEQPEHPVLVLDIAEGVAPASFRVIPSRLAVVENNLSIANLSFDELRSQADPDGVYRGTPAEPLPAERSVNHEDLVGAANRAEETPVVQQLRQDLEANHAPTLTARLNNDLYDTYTVLAGQTHRPDLKVGRDEMLEVLEHGGRGYGIHLPLIDSYWTIFLDPSSLDLQAAMKVFYPPQPAPVVPHRVV